MAVWTVCAARADLGDHQRACAKRDSLSRWTADGIVQHGTPPSLWGSNTSVLYILRLSRQTGLSPILEA